LVTGRALQFDHARGYGFVAADDGDEDVFLHASVFDEDPDEDGDPDELVPGTKMEFKVMASDGKHSPRERSCSASSASFAAPVGPGTSPGSGVPAAFVFWADTVTSVGSDEHRTGTACSGQGPSAGRRADVRRAVASRVRAGADRAVVENVPSLTGQQVLEVRQSVLESAKKHGWVDM
jgi:CspA family cold shock protein